MSNLTRKKPALRRVVDALSGLLIGTLAAGGVVLLAAGPIMNLPGKVDSNNALVVASVAPGTIGSQGRPIANLPGKVDANNALVVTLASGSTVDAPVFTGQSSFADGTAAAPSITFASDTDTGIYGGGGTIQTAINGASYTYFDGTSWIFRNSTLLGWSSGSPGLGADAILARDAANTIALKNAANQQFLRVYGGTSNYGQITAGAGAPEGVVTAVVGTLYLRTDGGAATTLYVKESGVGNTGWIAK